MAESSWVTLMGTMFGLDELKYCIFQHIYSMCTNQYTETDTHRHTFPMCFTVALSMQDVVVMDPLNAQLSGPLTPRGVC